jgi:sarcosine oxidase subunit alpha
MPAASDRSLGYITSCTPSTELGSWVGLALVSAGRRHLGERLIGLAPVHGESTDIEIISPHMLDPENTRVRA